MSKTPSRRCAVCLCTEENACTQLDGKPCHWHTTELCSACYELAERIALQLQRCSRASTALRLLADQEHAINLEGIGLWLIARMLSMNLRRLPRQKVHVRTLSAAEAKALRRGRKRSN